MLGNGLLLTVGSVLPFGVVVALTGLELMVCVLQSYVFCVLLCIYLNDSENLH
jgi:F-type H+-transporting ATPase subunit a